MVVALILPKRLAMPPQDLVGSMCGESFQWPEPFRRRNLGGNQDVDVVWHHDERMKLVPPVDESSVLQRLNNQLSDSRVRQMSRAKHGSIQETVHGHESFAGVRQMIWREDPFLRQCTMQSKCDEKRIADKVPVGKAALVVLHQLVSGQQAKLFSRKFGYGRLERRLQPRMAAPQASGGHGQGSAKGSSTWVS